jgi:hypothetical protein
MHPHIAKSFVLLEKRFADIMIDSQDIFNHEEFVPIEGGNVVKKKIHVEKILDMMKQRGNRVIMTNT